MKPNAHMRGDDEPPYANRKVVVSFQLHPWRKFGFAVQGHCAQTLVLSISNPTKVPSEKVSHFCDRARDGGLE